MRWLDSPAVPSAWSVPPPPFGDGRSERPTRDGDPLDQASDGVRHGPYSKQPARRRTATASPGNRATSIGAHNATSAQPRRSRTGSGSEWAERRFVRSLPSRNVVLLGIGSCCPGLRLRRRMVLFAPFRQLL